MSEPKKKQVDAYKALKERVETSAIANLLSDKPTSMAGLIIAQTDELETMFNEMMADDQPEEGEV